MPPFLAFSGGKESVALAHMFRHAEPVLVWVNPGGTAFPHMAEFVCGYRERYKLVELQPGLRQRWATEGLPTEETWPACCRALRTGALVEFAARQPEPGVFMHGQRRDDAAPGVREHAFDPVSGWRTWAPLWNWSADDVMAYIQDRGLALPPQYAAGHSDSLECSICPAQLTPERVAYMRSAYPEMLAEMEAA